MNDIDTVWHSERTLVFGHRGASHAAPENTMAAFNAAAAAGADGIELDVHLTADGVPVVMHNAGVEATTNGVGRIGELTAAQVRALDAAAHFREPLAFAGERVPLFEEVLEGVGDRLLINIELKPQSGPDGARRATALAEAVAARVRAHNLARRVWVSSFEPFALYAMRRAAPEIRCGLLYSPLNFTTWLLLPFTPVDALHPHVSLVSSGFVQVAHALHKPVAVWTVDDPEVARQLAAWGVDVIITNEPAEIREALAQA